MGHWATKYVIYLCVFLDFSHKWSCELAYETWRWISGRQVHTSAWQKPDWIFIIELPGGRYRSPHSHGSVDSSFPPAFPPLNSHLCSSSSFFPFILLSCSSLISSAFHSAVPPSPRSWLPCAEAGSDTASKGKCIIKLCRGPPLVSRYASKEEIHTRQYSWCAEWRDYFTTDVKPHTCRWFVVRTENGHDQWPPPPPLLDRLCVISILTAAQVKPYLLTHSTP